MTVIATIYSYPEFQTPSGPKGMTLMPAGGAPASAREGSEWVVKPGGGTNVFNTFWLSPQPTQSLFNGCLFVVLMLLCLTFSWERDVAGA